MKSKAQPLRRHQRARLLDMVAEHLNQSCLQQVGGGVVESRSLSTFPINAQGSGIAGTQGAGYDFTHMHKQFRQRLAGCR